MFRVKNKGNIFHTFSSVSIEKFEQVNAGWDLLQIQDQYHDLSYLA